MYTSNLHSRNLIDGDARNLEAQCQLEPRQDLVCGMSAYR